MLELDLVREADKRGLQEVSRASNKLFKLRNQCSDCNTRGFSRGLLNRGEFRLGRKKFPPPVRKISGQTLLDFSILCRIGFSVFHVESFPLLLVLMTPSNDGAEVFWTPVSSKYSMSKNTDHRLHPEYGI